MDLNNHEVVELLLSMNQLVILLQLERMIFMLRRGNIIHIRILQAS